MARLIVVVGATGNQGGSVARRFLQESITKVRGLTRNPSSAAAQELVNMGVEVVKADLDDVDSLEKAFKGANIIFSVTNYWEPFFRPDCRNVAEKAGVSCRRYAYDVEFAQGKNIVDAAATTVETLDGNGFLVSTLSHAGKCSGGKFKELYHFDAKADVFPDYVRERYPELAGKMSCVQTGYFMTSYRLAPEAYFSKQPDGTFITCFTTASHKPVPHLNVNKDTGNFIFAVSQMPPEKSYMAEGTTCSWADFVATFAKVTGKTASYQQVTPEDMIEGTPDSAYGEELADMFSYSSDPGYDGGMKLLRAEDMRKMGIECPMTSLEEFMNGADFGAVVGQ